jgi:hypothetical protein
MAKKTVYICDRNSSHTFESEPTNERILVQVGEATVCEYDDLCPKCTARVLALIGALTLSGEDEGDNAKDEAKPAGQEEF